MRPSSLLHTYNNYDRCDVIRVNINHNTATIPSTDDISNKSNINSNDKTDGDNKAPIKKSKLS